MHAGEKNFPDAGGNDLAHGVHAAVPVVEIANDAHALGGGGPHGKMHAGHIVDHLHMGAEFFIDIVVRAFVEKVDVHLAEDGAEGVGIALAPGGALVVGEFERVGGAGFVAFDLALEGAFVVDARQGLGFGGFSVEDDADLRGVWPEYPG